VQTVKSTGPGSPGTSAGPVTPGGPVSPGTPAAFFASGTVNLTMPLASWLGLSDAPGNVAGYGPLDADDSRAIADVLSARPGTTWCLTLTDSHGRPVAHGCARAAPPPSPRHAEWPTGAPGAHAAGSRDGPADSPRDRPADSPRDGPADGPRDRPAGTPRHPHQGRPHQGLMIMEGMSPWEGHNEDAPKYGTRLGEMRDQGATGRGSGIRAGCPACGHLGRKRKPDARPSNLDQNF
jgi:hypothetical protein